MWNLCSLHVSIMWNVKKHVGNMVLEHFVVVMCEAYVNSHVKLLGIYVKHGNLVWNSCDPHVISCGYMFFPCAACDVTSFNVTTWGNMFPICDNVFTCGYIWKTWEIHVVYLEGIATLQIKIIYVCKCSQQWPVSFPVIRCFFNNRLKPKELFLKYFTKIQRLENVPTEEYKFVYFVYSNFVSLLSH